MNIKLRIEDPVSCIELMREMKRIGLLRDISNEIVLRTDQFPMDIPIDAEKLLEMVNNPVIKKVFGKKMDTVLTTQVASIVGAQA